MSWCFDLWPPGVIKMSNSLLKIIYLHLNLKRFIDWLTDTFFWNFHTGVEPVSLSLLLLQAKQSSRFYWWFQPAQNKVTMSKNTVEVRLEIRKFEWTVTKRVGKNCFSWILNQTNSWVFFFTSPSVGSVLRRICYSRVGFPTASSPDDAV